jgi:hypothetical protein
MFCHRFARVLHEIEQRIERLRAEADHPAIGCNEPPLPRFQCESGEGVSLVL